MAMQLQTNNLGVDVAKRWLDISDGKQVTRIDNEPRAIKIFLKQLLTPCCIAIESTNTYHEAFLELAIKAKHTLYVIDAYRLSRYRDAVGIRVKTDVSDAHLLLRYMEAEKHQLVPFKAIPKQVKRLNQLLKARAKLAKTKTTISLALGQVNELSQTRSSLMKRIMDAMALIDRRILDCIEKAGYSEDYHRCLCIPGIGPSNAAALLATYHRGHFRKSDAFIAYIGLDVRVRESGYYKGRRKLTKQGNPEVRRLLFNAARSAAKTKKWNEYYLDMRKRGHSTTATAVALSRKIARLAFALMRDQSEYQVG
jgi:transposase